MNEKMSCIIILEQGTESYSKHDGVEWPLGVFIIFISNTNHRKSLSLSSYDPEIPLKTGGWARFRLR